MRCKISEEHHNLKKRLSGLLRAASVSVLLLSVLCLSSGAQNGLDDHAADTTSLTAAAAAPGQPDSLERVWAEAIVSADRLKAGRNSTEEARGALATARSVRVSMVAATGGQLWLDKGPSAVVNTPGLPGVPVALDNQFWAGRVVAPLPLFISGHNRSGVGMAKVGWKAAQAEEHRETMDLKLGVADAYVRVLRAMGAVRAATISVASLASHAQDVSNVYERRSVARNDLLASHVVLADACQREIQARNSLEIACASYNLVLARSATNVVRLEDLPPPPAPGDVHDLTALAFKQRPELVALAEQAEALRREARRVRANALPSIGVSGGYSDIENNFLQHDQVWAVGVVGIWNIFDSGLTRHKDRAADDKADALAALQGEAMDRVSQQVRQAWTEVNEARRRLEVTCDAAGQAEENLTVARACYRAGTGTNAEVIEAETLGVRSLDNQNNAFYDTVMAAFKLRRAVGDL